MRWFIRAARFCHAARRRRACWFRYKFIRLAVAPLNFLAHLHFLIHGHTVNELKI